MLKTFVPLMAVLLLLLGTLSAAQQTSKPLDSSLMNSINQIPKCALNCLGQYGSSIGCALLDIKCQCASKNSTKILQPCLKSNCTYEETFKLLHVQADLCDKPHDNRSLDVKLTAWITGIVSVGALALRFVSRCMGGSKLWWDDWLQLISIILVIPMTVALLLNAEAGIGHHVWDLTFRQVKDIGRWTYITTIFWGIELLLLKFSILCLYLRIFPNPWLKRAVIAFSVFTLLFTGPLIGMACFQCIPIHAIWNLDAQKTAKCIDWIAVLRATVIYEVIAEIVLFILPVPVVLNLKLKRGKKIQLMIFFGLGTCIIGISIARLPTLPGVVSSDDQPYTTVSATILGFTASVVGHVCAAVPTIRALVRLMCGSGTLDGSRPSRFAGTNSYSSGSKDRAWLPRRKDSEISHSRNLSARSQEKSSAVSSSDHFGIDLSSDNQQDIILADLQPIRDRVYQGPRLRGQCFEQWNSVRPRVAPVKEEPEPAIFRDTYTDGLEDTSSEKEILQEQFFGGSANIERGNLTRDRKF